MTFRYLIKHAPKIYKFLSGFFNTQIVLTIDKNSINKEDFLKINHKRIKMRLIKRIDIVRINLIRIKM